MNALRNVLFDLDGTLVDSRAAIRASLAHALARIGARYPADLPVETVIGTALVDIFSEHFDIRGDRAERAIVHYRAHYDAEAHRGSRVYDNVPDTLVRLRAAGLRLFVATVKPTIIAGKVLRDMGLAEHFEGVAGSSMDHARREKADIIRHALDAHRLEPTASAMVGDRAQDIEGARLHGLRAVGVRYGFGGDEELRIARPDDLVDRFDELPGLLLPAAGAG